MSSSQVPYIDIHTHHSLNRKGVLALYSCRWGTEPLPLSEQPYWCGIHPWDVDSVSKDFLEKLMTTPTSGIGEIGLDFLPGRPDRFLQTVWFERQLEIAAKRSLPVMLHIVRAHSETIKLLNQYRDKIPTIIVHGFKGHFDLAKEYIRRGIMLSFGISTFQSPKTMDTFCRIPMTSLFLESDDKETDIPYLYNEFAHLRGIMTEDFKKQLFENYVKVFET